jgi:hypothetical protein
MTFRTGERNAASARPRSVRQGSAYRYDPDVQMVVRMLENSSAPVTDGARFWLRCLAQWRSEPQRATRLPSRMGSGLSQSAARFPDFWRAGLAVRRALSPAIAETRDLRVRDDVPLPGSQCGARNGRTIPWTAHDNELFVSLSVTSCGRAACRRNESPMSSSMVNFVAIIVRRSGATSLKPC